MKKKQNKNSEKHFQDLIGIIKIGLKDKQMRKNAPDKYRSRLGMFLCALNEFNKQHQCYETFDDLCRRELSISSSYANKQIRCYKKGLFAKITATD